MSLENWEKTLRVFQNAGLVTREREYDLNPQQPKQQKQRSKPTTNVRVDDQILEQVFELLPDSATPLEEIAEDIALELNLTIDQLVQSVINLQQDDRVLVDRSDGQVIVMRSP